MSQLLGVFLPVELKRDEPGLREFERVEIVAREGMGCLVGHDRRQRIGVAADVGP